MGRRLVIDSDGKVDNTIVIEPEAVDEWCRGTGCILAPAGVDGEIGGTYSDGVYTAPAPQEGEEE